jgi:hypothetical protein
MTLQDETTLDAPDTDRQPEHDDPKQDEHAGDLAPIPLPELTRRRETRRRRAQRRQDRLRRMGQGAAIAAATIVIASLAIKAWPDKANDDKKASPTAADIAASASAPMLLAQQDAAGKAVSLILIVPAAKDRGGAVVLIPPGTMTEVASLGLEPVGQSLLLGGPGRLDATVENLLGASIGGVLVYDDHLLTELVKPAGAINVRLPQRVEQVDATGQVDVLYEPGLHSVAPGEVAQLLAVKGRGNDLDRLVRHQAFLDAWLAKLKADRKAIPAQPAPLHAALAALLGGPVSTRVLPVHSIGTTDDGELYQVDQAELRDMVKAVFPGTRPGAATRPRLQVLNGTGSVGLAQKASDKLGPAGVEIKLTGNAGRLDYEESQIVFYRRGDEAVAQRVQKALGVGRLVFSRTPIDVVDVTVIVGRDFQPQ